MQNNNMVPKITTLFLDAIICNHFCYLLLQESYLLLEIFTIDRYGLESFILC